MNTKAITSNSTLKRESRPFRDVLVLAGDFFMKKGIVFDTMRRLAKQLESEGLPTRS
jgi:hypothetical protein